MGLCLVTKLKESVADSSLSKIGEKTLVLAPQKSFTIRGKGIELRGLTGNFDIALLGGNTYEGLNHYVDVSANYFSCRNTSSNPLTIGVNNLEVLNVFSADGGANALEIDLNFFEKSKGMSELNLTDQIITGGELSDLSEITNNSTLTGLVFTRCIGLKGSIEDIASLRMIDSAFPSFFGCPEVTGSVEEFVRGQRANGRTNANLANGYWITQSGITFNGKTYADLVSISWTASTITVNGETINA